MEDPRTGVKTVIQQLVCRPTLQQQAEALRRYFTPDVHFYHFYINISGGRGDLTAIYQLAELLVNYQAVQFHDIIYDDSPNADALCVHMTVYVRPGLAFYTEQQLEFFTLLELQEHTREDGERVKLIKVQRDYFESSPIISILPIVGRVYRSSSFRALLGRSIAMLVRSIRYVLCPRPHEDVC